MLRGSREWEREFDAVLQGGKLPGALHWPQSGEEDSGADEGLHTRAPLCGPMRGHLPQGTAHFERLWISN